MRVIEDHPLRFELSNELHARPFPALEAPSSAAYIAFKREDGDNSGPSDLDHLKALLDRFGATHPAPGATHHSCRIGRHFMKWERHSEFVTYTVVVDGLPERPFDPDHFDVFPESWLAESPGLRITSAILRFEMRESMGDALEERMSPWFVQESLAVSEVLDGAAVIASDFRIDPAGHVRFAVFPGKNTGRRRTGRIMQRLCEIETYKTMSMLGLREARELAGPLGRIETDLGRVTQAMTREGTPPENTLGDLLPLAAELENLMARSSYRFGATAAYAAIVEERVRVLREERFHHRQTFQEFMNRRYDPAMRTVVATQGRLRDMSLRALRVSDLLRTRVDVERSAQSQELLVSMDGRAAAQLRLQKTVEGLSVVAISYYAVNLAAYFLAPVAETYSITSTVLTAALVPVTMAAVWHTLVRIRKLAD